jgi:diacylglycerol kinase family enzyme
VTIERGAPWGVPGALPHDGPVAFTDADVAARVAGGACLVGVAGTGDLARTVGALAEPTRLFGQEAMTLPCDLLRVFIDNGAAQLAVAHVVVRHRLWRGPLVAIMNAQFIGRYDVAPRSHPNDGRADVIDASSLSVSDRWKAWTRLPAGTHVPHPDISQQRVSEWSRSWDSPVNVRIDSGASIRARSLRIETVADGFSLVV